jgi:hypothetical protein
MSVAASTTVSFCRAATVGASPALTNAIFAATGIRIRRLPCQGPAAFLVRHWAKLSVLKVMVAVATMTLIAVRPRDPTPAPSEGREWGTVDALIAPDKGEVHPLSGGTLKLRSVAGAGRGARNTGRSRLALPSRYAGLQHGSVAWVRIGS